MTQNKKGSFAVIALIIGTLSLSTSISVAGDVDAQLKASKQCSTKSNRARELAWDLKRKGEKQCAAMPITSADFFEREKLKDAQQECYDEVESEFDNSIFEIDQTTEECHDAAMAL